MNSPYTLRATIFRGATSCVTLRLLADQELLREALQQERQNQRLYAGLLTQTKPQIIKKRDLASSKTNCETESGCVRDALPGVAPKPVKSLVGCFGVQPLGGTRHEILKFRELQTVGLGMSTAASSF